MNTKTKSKSGFTLAEVLITLGIIGVVAAMTIPTLIERYKEANPTINGNPTIGFEILTHDWRYFCLENPPQFIAGYPNDGSAIVDPETLEAKNYNTIPEAKEYYKKLLMQ